VAIKINNLPKNLIELSLQKNDLISNALFSVKYILDDFFGE
jgi:hypothetical protein